MMIRNFAAQRPQVIWIFLLCISCFLFLLLIPHTRKPFSDILEASSLCTPEGHHDQYNPCLIRYVRENLLLPPSGLPFVPAPATPRVPGVRSVQPAIDQKVDFIRKYFPNPGFFIECGANDGTFISPTLKLEQDYNWTGVLIEGDPAPFRHLVALNRNAWMINTALCTSTHSDVITFYARPDTSSPGGSLTNPGINYNIIDIPCIPLYTILATIGITKVDFFSLDVEGVELEVLKTVPFDKIIFKVLMVEHAHVPGFQRAVIRFLTLKNYVFIGTLLGFAFQDSVFVHQSAYTRNMNLSLKYDPTPPRKPI